MDHVTKSNMAHISRPAALSLQDSPSKETSTYEISKETASYIKKINYKPGALKSIFHNQISSFHTFTFIAITWKVKNQYDPENILIKY